MTGAAIYCKEHLSLSEMDPSNVCQGLKCDNSRGGAPGASLISAK